jgi:hypothetical protein
MATSTPLPSDELEKAVRKLIQHEPLTRAERTLVQRTLDESPPAPEPDEEEDGEDEQGGVILSPEDEHDLEQVIAENDEDERAGRGISWEKFLAERTIRRAG